MEETLQKIQAYADQAHGDQTRKYSAERFIHHPIRVMEMCRQYTDDPAVLAAALLHDVLEDTPVTKAELQAFLLTVMDPPTALKTVQLVEELTDVYLKEKYPYWNRRQRKTREAARIAKTSGSSQTVKYADIIDNCSGLLANDPEFAPTFLRECSDLLKRIPSGDRRLYQRARDSVAACLLQAGTPSKRGQNNRWKRKKP
ncbi:HD domain-containing protein [Paraflavisolibacter sp. H34]|uniref:HD domain-containing protein n=1 Tax=Huijunlia imazamoxiresistens TaxID=3127457 RepID=UPI0030166521